MSFPRYERLKKSGVEWLRDIPEHWEIKPMLAIGRERVEGNTNLQETNLLSLSYGRIVRKDINSSEGLLPESFETYQSVCPGDIIFRLTDLQNDKRSLRTAISNERGIITSAYVTFKPERALPQYINYLLRSYDCSKVFYAMGSGVRQSMTFADIKRLQLVIPPYKEQKLIVSFLDHETAKIDALIQEQQRLIELLKEKRQTVISHAVTKGLDPKASLWDSGVDWLGFVPAHWSVCPVSDRYNIQLGKMLDSPNIAGHCLRPYLRVADVQWGEINIENLPQMDFDEEARRRFALLPGDLLVNEGGSYPGRSAVWSSEIECYYQKALHRLRPRRAERDSTEFFYSLMTWACGFGVFVANGNEATIEHLPAERLRRYRFAFPPIHEQRAIAETLRRQDETINSLRSHAEKTIEILAERRNALISAAVTGQIDVRNYATSDTLIPDELSQPA